MDDRELLEAVETGNCAFIGGRADDPARNPIAGSTPSPCNECRCDVMLSPATRARMTKLSVVLCPECAADVANRRGEKWVDPGRSDEQLDEMAANGIEPRRFHVPK